MGALLLNPCFPGVFKRDTSPKSKRVEERRSLSHITDFPLPFAREGGQGDRLLDNLYEFEC